MKKILVLFVSILFATSLISCSDDEETNQLIGKWKIVSNDACEAKSTFTLEKDNFTLIDYPHDSDEKPCISKVSKGIYTTKGNKLILSMPGNPFSLNMTYTISGDLLTIVFEKENVPSKTIVFKKI